MATKGLLLSLDLCHRHALEVFLKEFDAKPEELHGYFCDRDSSIEAAVYLLAAWSRGEELKRGRVPCSTFFWEVDEQLLGVINLRHYLTPELREHGGHIGYAVAPSCRRKGVAKAMLSAVLEECRSRSLSRVLLTCDGENRASSRTIEVNGGVLEREAWVEARRHTQRWYWIDL